MTGSWSTGCSRGQYRFRIPLQRYRAIHPPVRGGWAVLLNDADLLQETFIKVYINIHVTVRLYISGSGSPYHRPPIRSARLHWQRQDDLSIRRRFCPASSAPTPEVMSSSVADRAVPRPAGTPLPATDPGAFLQYSYESLRSSRLAAQDSPKPRYTVPGSRCAKPRRGHINNSMG